jgi:4-hydroxy-3-methylbut-2-en-1-yl diphosphate reductase
VTLRVVCALRIESAALRPLPVTRTGMGPERVARAGLTFGPDDEVVVAGFAGAVDPELAPGDVILATTVRSAGGERSCPVSGLLGEPIRRRGLRVVTGTLYSADRILAPQERRALDGVSAVDMESYWVAEAAGDRKIAVVRVIVDTANRRLLDLRTLPAGIRAFRALRRVAAALPALTDPFRKASH